MLNTADKPILCPNFIGFVFCRNNLSLPRQNAMLNMNKKNMFCTQPLLFNVSNVLIQPIRSDKILRIAPLLGKLIHFKLAMVPVKSIYYTCYYTQQTNALGVHSLTDGDLPAYTMYLSALWRRKKYTLYTIKWQSLARLCICLNPDLNWLQLNSAVRSSDIS